LIRILSRLVPALQAEGAFSGGLNEPIAFSLLRGGDCHLGLGFNSGRKQRREIFAGLRRQDGGRASTRAIGWDPSQRILNGSGYDFVPARSAP
jgi:hypothetical protein